jgi:hypothetical protein
MTMGFGFRALGLLVCTTLVLSACDDDGGGGKAGTDAGMDAGEHEDEGGTAEDTSPPRDAGGDAGDSAAANDAAEENPYQCEPPAGPDGAIEQDQPCCDGLGTCVELAGDAGSSLGIGDCNAAENLRCLPVSVAADAGQDGGTSGLAKCRMKVAGTPDGGADYEGRCVPECLTRGASTLEQGECQDEFVCVPCYSLITGASTGACENNGDQPVDDAPPGFAECGDALGYCIPATSVGSTGSNLQQLTCEEDERCAPKQRVVAPDSCFAPCDSLFGAGACLPAFLIPMESRSFLQPASCETGELCSPCINPSTMMRTGACD